MFAIYCIGGLVAFLFFILHDEVYCLEFRKGRFFTYPEELKVLILCCVFWPFFITVLVAVLIQDEIKKRFGKEG